MDEIGAVASVIKELNVLQLSVLVALLSQIGVVTITFFILKNRANESTRESELNKMTLSIMIKIQETFVEVTESFKKEQEKDWKRTSDLLQKFEEILDIQKGIYRQVNILNFRIDRLEKDLLKTEDKKDDGQN